MNITLLAIGKTDASYFIQAIDEYKKRLIHYINFKFEMLPDIKNVKNLTEEQQKDKEGKILLKYIQPGDMVVLLDESGKELNSIDFSLFIEKKMNQGLKHLIFIIGGPYGFSKEVYANANDKVSLSQMTFSHQMVRLIFIEQLYRAMSIINNEPYHHV